MMNKYSLGALSALALIVLPTLASAQLTFTFTESLLTGGQNRTLTFAATLTNTGTDTVFLNGNDFSVSGSDITLDDTKFFMNAPLSLNANGTWTGEIFDAIISPTAPADVYSGAFTITGGADSSTFDNLARQTFQVRVVPAPSGLLAVIVGIVPGVGVLLRRRRMSRQ